MVMYLTKQWTYQHLYEKLAIITTDLFLSQNWQSPSMNNIHSRLHMMLHNGKTPSKTF